MAPRLSAAYLRRRFAAPKRWRCLVNNGFNQLLLTLAKDSKSRVYSRSLKAVAWWNGALKGSRLLPPCSCRHTKGATKVSTKCCRHSCSVWGVEIVLMVVLNNNNKKVATTNNHKQPQTTTRVSWRKSVKCAFFGLFFSLTFECI